MKKIYMIPLFAVLLMGIVSALIIIPGGYQLNKDEMASVSDELIANYMLNQFQIADYKLMENRIIIYYNITYVEPTFVTNTETNETETQYKVFTQLKPFIIEKDLWNQCLNITTEETCVAVLVNNPEPFYWTPEVGEDEENVTIEIKSTYLQAYQEQERQYYRAREIRDNAISNDLDELFGMIG
jgi:hypothetical protein